MRHRRQASTTAEAQTPSRHKKYVSSSSAHPFFPERLVPHPPMCGECYGVIALINYKSVPVEVPDHPIDMVRLHKSTLIRKQHPVCFPWFRRNRLAQLCRGRGLTSGTAGIALREQRTAWQEMAQNGWTNHGYSLAVIGEENLSLAYTRRTPLLFALRQIGKTARCWFPKAVSATYWGGLHIPPR